MTEENQDYKNGWLTVDLYQVIEVQDHLRKPINAAERTSRISGKSINELYPYYGATGQVGLIDDYITDGQFVLIGEDAAPFFDHTKPVAYKISGKTWVNNHAHVLKPLINTEFCLHYLNSFNYAGFVEGTTRLKLTQGALKRIPVPVPPLFEQQRMVAKIQELFSELDKGIETLKTAQQQLKIYRQAVLKYAFEGRLTKPDTLEGELPEGWVTKTLAEFVNTIDAGKSFKCDERPPIGDEIGVLKVSAVTWGKYNEQESKTVTDSSKINERYFVKKGDFLISRANTLELVGAVVIAEHVTQKVMLSDKTLRIKFSPALRDCFALYFLRSHEGRKQLQLHSSGNQESMRNIGQIGIKSVKLSIPLDLKVQDLIIQEIESRLSVCEKIEESIEQGLQQAEALRQSILKKAFEGKLVPQDPSDEPASVLLERIKAERQKAQPEKKIKTKKVKA